jgi:hypothetical protein
MLCLSSTTQQCLAETTRRAAKEANSPPHFGPLAVRTISLEHEDMSLSRPLSANRWMASSVFDTGRMLMLESWVARGLVR